MQLIPLGINGPFPAPGGATSGYLVSHGGTVLAIDMGCGTLGRLTAHTAPEEMAALLLTHWHYDHCSDVLPLAYRLAAQGKVLHVYAPADGCSPIRQLVESDPCFLLHDVSPGDTVVLGGIAISVHEARHPVPAVMYRLTADGRTLCCTGDTNTVDGLTDFARDADLLLADGLFTTSAWAEGKPHLSAAHVAQLAADAGAKRFLITHLNPAIDPVTLLREARAIRIDAELAEAGKRYDV